MAHVLFRQLDKVAAYPVPDSTRAAMQHQPDAIALVKADLDKMVAGAESAEMRRRMCIARHSWMLRDDLLVAAFERGPLLAGTFGYLAPRTDVVAASMIGASVRHRCFDSSPQRFEIIGKVRRYQARAHRRHSAADINTYRRRDDRALGRDYGADGRADSPMHVGHRGDPPEDE